MASVELTSTVYYYAVVTILANAAKVLGKMDDYSVYQKLAADIKDSFNAKYLLWSTGVYGTGIQTEQSVPLYWGLAPDSLKSKIAARLAERVIADSVKLDVGLLGSKAILNALSENGYADLAYKLASSRTLPSWGWWIVNGATTLYEHWTIDLPRDYSQNHIMFGEIGAWFYKGLGGIFPDPAAPGFKHILLRPNIVAGLDSFTAVHHGPYGEIGSGWKRVAKHLVYTAIVPPGSSATLTLTVAGQVKMRTTELSAGKHSFSFND
jgi:alpha-L-rhamnosidase